MAGINHSSLVEFMDSIAQQNPNEVEFIQAVQEVAEDVLDYIEDKPEYQEYQILKRMTEPDRIVSFRVCWEDDKNRIHVQRGFRVQNNNAIGPYKGGLRFHPSVTQSVLKFLAFEQTLKNSLTGLPMGGGKGGADFDPKGKSDHEVMRFCQSFMTELYRHVGEDTDVPAGDIGVGAREIGYMFGQYKRITNRFTGVLTGKGLSYGGSRVRPEATGYGAVYFLEDMLRHRGLSMEGRSVVVSGAGNVATHAAEKVMQLGGKVVSLSDSGGFLHDNDGFDELKLAWIKKQKNELRGSLAEYVNVFKGASWHKGKRPWSVPCDIALPCATQNEVFAEDVGELLKNGCIAISEGANMPVHLDGVRMLKESGICYAPGKAANAGGVAVSGLEMSQNSVRESWSEVILQQRLRDIMKDIHDRCVEYGARPDGTIDYVKGANVAGFVKVANAMLAYGVV
jgi:glutamate dehydrogenase (NADP+)